MPDIIDSLIIVVFIIAVFFIAFLIGTVSGTNHTRKEAIQAGVGAYEVTNKITGEVKFVFKKE